MLSKENVLDKANKTLAGMVQVLEDLEDLSLNDVKPDETVLAVMDMINGFAREGPLQSPRVEAIIPEVARLVKSCKEKSIPVLAFADSHPPESPEFESYPPHSVEGTSESEIVDEIKEIGGYERIPKRSTNGFHEPKFLKWLKDNDQIKNWIVVGNATDICVYQFATTIRTYSIARERDNRVIVPMPAVNTFDDGGLHQADLIHVVFLHSLLGNGIEVVSKVTV